MHKGSIHKEAEMTIGGVKLDNAQSMTVRVAVACWLMELEDPKNRKKLGEMGNLYQARLIEIQELIFKNTK